MNHLGVYRRGERIGPDGSGDPPRPGRAGWLYDRSGRLAVFQRPNLPIVVWIAAVAAGAVAPAGWPTRLADVVRFGSPFTWAWLELFDGDARVRRVLGGVVLAALVVSRVRS